MKRNDNLVCHLCAFSTVFLWAGTNVANRILRGAFTANQISAVRFLIAAVIMLIIAVVKRVKLPRKLPDWLSTSKNLEYRSQINAFFDLPETIPTLLPEYADEPEPKKVQKLAHLQVFSCDPHTLEARDTAILFNYRAPDLLGNAKETLVDIFQ